MFVQVVRARSFAEASRRLGVPSNTLSRRVRQLETALDTRLMQRSTRKLTFVTLSTYGTLMTSPGPRARPRTRPKRSRTARWHSGTTMKTLRTTISSTIPTRTTTTTPTVVVEDAASTAGSLSSP